jgi:hypothetical protein
MGMNSGHEFLNAVIDDVLSESYSVQVELDDPNNLIWFFFSKNCPSNTCSNTGKFPNNTTRNAHAYS